MKKPTKPKRIRTLTINRAIWLTGEHLRALIEEDSSLLTKKGNQCCLGFYVLKAGYTKRQILGKGLPCDLARAIKRIPQLLDVDRRDNNETVSDLVDHNDSKQTSRKVRERQIITGFKKLGTKVRFVGRYPKELR